MRPRANGEHETIPADIVFRSVGYLGVPLPEVPFDDRRGVIPNDRGRVLAGEGQEPVVGFYASGWIKRGPSGVIGTNKPDAVETVERMLEDLPAGAVMDPAHPDVAGAERLVLERQTRLRLLPGLAPSRRPRDRPRQGEWTPAGQAHAHRGHDRSAEDAGSLSDPLWVKKTAVPPTPSPSGRGLG